MRSYTFTVSERNDLVRVDKFLSLLAEEFSRSRIQKLLDDKQVLVNKKAVKANYKVKAGDSVVLNVPDAVEMDIPAEDIPLDIVYEDDDIIVVNKRKGMVVHPALGHYTGTLVNALMYHCKDNLSGIGGELRPGIVHRIDMNTTGLLVVCKNDYAHNFIAEQLKVHSITRRYQAIIYNCPKDNEGIVDEPIGRDPYDRKKMAVNHIHGKDAVTHYRVLKKFQNFSYIECELETGRTHQIRVHMTHIGCPLLGDDIYGPKNCPYNLIGQTLHAKTLGFIHPTTKKYMEFDSELPEYFQKLLKILESK